jgi:hypothetical protein
VRKQALLALMLATGLCARAAEFKFEDDGKSLSIREGDKPVLSYNYEPVAPPEGQGLDKARWSRSCYIHPLYGLDGDVLTQDFPVDHRHHRGVFWVWPHTHYGDRQMDLWLHEVAEQRFQKWIKKDIRPDAAEVEVENAWVFKDNPTTPIVKEDVDFTVHPADETSRAIDFKLVFTNVSDKPVSFLGATGKGYGGFCLRPDATRTGLQFSSAQGPRKEDALYLQTPWADESSREKPDGPFSGAAIFQNPANPGYPHPGWILRNYGFLGASWPHLETFVLPQGKSIELKYRLCIHRGTAEEAKVGEAFKAYESANQPAPKAESK